jgi:hypothetical protein
MGARRIRRCLFSLLGRTTDCRIGHRLAHSATVGRTRRKPSFRSAIEESFDR